jgi:hypothetical protein
VGGFFSWVICKIWLETGDEKKKRGLKKNNEEKESKKPAGKKKITANHPYLPGCSPCFFPPRFPNRSLSPNLLPF